MLSTLVLVTVWVFLNTFYWEDKLTKQTIHLTSLKMCWSLLNLVFVYSNYLLGRKIYISSQLLLIHVIKPPTILLWHYKLFPLFPWQCIALWTHWLRRSRCVYNYSENSSRCLFLWTTEAQYTPEACVTELDPVPESKNSHLTHSVISAFPQLLALILTPTVQATQQCS